MGPNDWPSIANDNAASGGGGNGDGPGEVAARLKDEALTTLRRAILAELRRGARCCTERTETPYAARKRLAQLTEMARNVDRLATAAVLLVRAPLA